MDLPRNLTSLRPAQPATWAYLFLPERVGDRASAEIQRVPRLFPLVRMTDVLEPLFERMDTKVVGYRGDTLTYDGYPQLVLRPIWILVAAEEGRS